MLDDDLKNMKVPSTSLIVSKRNSGKTVMAIYIIYWLLKQKKINNIGNFIYKTRVIVKKIFINR